jgi:hypothetical protein
LNSKQETFSDIEHRLRGTGTYVTATEREKQRAVRSAELQIGIMDDVAEILISERRIAGAEHIASSTAWRVLRE